jgi:hypothetical protein
MIYSIFLTAEGAENAEERKKLSVLRVLCGKFL